VLRRRFLVALLLGLAALVGGAPGRWLRARAEGASAEALFSAPARRLLALFADLIVPAWNGRPAASDGDFVERFEALARGTPGRADAYRRHFERFVAGVDARVALLPGPADAAALEALLDAWYREWRSESKPSFEAQFFEMLRRDVLRTHYASPAGWKALDYHGPAHRPPGVGSAA
jgi:hypothetical protein